MRPEAAPLPAENAPSVAYVVLDADLQRADARRFDRLLAGFAAGYAAMFHGDEAESSAQWTGRILGKAQPQPVMRIAVAVQGSGETERVIGGAACEYYRAGGCALCTYLYVLDRPEYRRRGYARALLDTALLACAALGPVRAALAEVEWPPLLPTTRFGSQLIADAQRRLHFFERLGARRITLDYVQPALGPAQQSVPWLRLLLLPTPDAQDEPSLRRALDLFLEEFHSALAQEAGRALDAALLESQRVQVASAPTLIVPLH